MATDKWIRALGPQEAAYHEEYNRDSILVCYVIRLSSAKEIKGSDAEAVFECIIRKTPSLRMYVEEKDGGDLWFREMAEPRIDFEVVPNADPYEEYHKFAHHRYSSSGPFWAVKLLPWSPGQEVFVNKTKMEDPEEASKLPFVCHILLASHHSITDGHSSHKIIKLMLNLFDEVLEGKDIIVNLDDSSIFLARDEENRIHKEIEDEFKNKLRSIETSETKRHDVVTECLLPEGYKVPINNTFETVCLTKNLDKKTTIRFSKLCKEKGVTFHTGFTAILDSAYVKLLRDANVERDTYRITVLHSVNNRSYFKESNNSLGNGGGHFGTCVDTPQNVVQHFWDYAKQLHKILTDKKVQKISLENNVVAKITGTNPLQHFNPEEIKERSLPPMVTYCTTNMLDVTKVLAEEDAERRKFTKIRLDWYDRLSILQRLPYLWTSVYQTYNDQLMHSLQYNGGLMSATTAQKLSDNIFEIVNQIA